MNKTTERLADLSPEEQRALLAQLMRDQSPQPKSAPLTLAQERIWFLNQVDPDSPAFNMAVAVRLTGRLDMAALQRSLEAVVRRHETLRTTFALQDGHPVQIIAPAQSVSLPVVNLQSFPAAEREARAGQWILGETDHPFDLTRGPLLRSTLLQLDKEEHALLLNIHHIVSDGWSQAVLLRELTRFYEAFVSGQPASLPDLPLQYAEFARWQRQAAQGETLAADLAYWKRQLAGPLPVLEMVGDLSPGGTTAAEVVRQKRMLPQPLFEAVKAFSRQQGVTLFTTLLAAFKVLLHRYTGQTDIVVGSPIAGRDRAEVEGLIGLFIDTLVLRTDLSGNPTFLELLHRVRQVVLDGMAHRALSFGQLVEALQPTRDLNRNPLFQVVFILQNFPSVSLDLPDLRMEPFPVELQAAEAADLLGIAMQDTGQELACLLERRKKLLISNSQEHLQTLLAAAVADPRQPISRLPLMTETEQQQIVIEWNRTETAHPQGHCVHELLEPQMDCAPDAVAVVFDQEQLTYGELDRRASQLAHYLRACGVRPGALAGLCVERSVEMVVGLLGIMRAGGAYVPLDPSYPAELLSSLTKSAHLAVLLTQKRLLDRLPAVQAKVICLDDDWPAIALQSPERPNSGVTPDHLLYVIYTSGSTGQPKGAGVNHRSFANLLHWFVTAFGLTSADSTLVISSLSFDLTQKNYYAPLMIGGQLQLAPSEHYDPQQILQAVCHRQISWINCTPSAFYPLVEQSGDDTHTQLISMRYLFLGGEPILVPRLSEWLKSDQCKTTVVNTYGPTECADICAFCRLDDPGRFAERMVPIGGPVHNARLFILDRNLEPQPVGVAGELYVAGAGVGLGYMNDPRLTALKFIPHPFANGLGERLYRTGDLVCYRPDGNLEFLGRIDHQVKVRGFRIELGEIEAVLGRHPAVRETVVLAREDVPGEKRLVAYLVPHPGEAPSPDDLRGFADKQLPDYMLPSAFVRLESLPLSPNGKINRRALPPPDPTLFERGEEFVPPESPVEEQLAAVWHEFLAAEQIGIYDNFFDLGGHSLSATQVIYHINQAFQIELSVRTIFEEPTIAGLALSIKETLLQEIEQELEEEPAS